MKLRFFRLLLSMVLLFSLVSTPFVSAHAPDGYIYKNSIGYDSGCTPFCDGYFTGHFSFYFYYKEYSPSNWYIHHAHATLTTQNCRHNGSYMDTWEAERLAVFGSSTTPIYNSWLHNEHKHQQDYSSFLEEWNPAAVYPKGNNIIMAYFEYLLGNCQTGERNVEAWYPKRYVQNM